MITYFYLLVLTLCLAGCVDHSNKDAIFPFDEKISWHYDTVFKAGRKSNQHKMIVSNQNMELLDGKEVLSRRYHNGEVAYYGKSEEGIYRVALRNQNGDLRKDPKDHYLIRFPLTLETEWDVNSKAFFLERAVREINAGQASLSSDLKIDPLIVKYKIDKLDENIKVSAGNFKNCIRITGSGKTNGSGAEIGTVAINVEQTDWYAPGVGLVKSVRHEKSNLDWAKSSSFTMELEKIYTH